MKMVLSTVVTALLTTTAIADVPKVATDIAPVHSIVARIMQGIGEPSLIVPPSASPHDHAMRPSEARDLEQADVVVWIGHSLTPWLEDSIEALADDATQIELQDVAAVSLEFREGATFEAHEHHDEHEEDHDDHDEEHDEDHDDHDEEHEDEHAEHGHESDPHMWLDPFNAVAWAPVIARALADQDPDNEEVYFGNALEFVQEASKLSGQIAAQLEPYNGHPFVVFHDAYHYFEARFDVEAVGAISASDAQAPSPKRLREIENLIEDTKANCVFSEPQFNPGLVAAVAANTKVETIDPLGFDLELGPQMYGQLLTNIADGFEACLGEN